MALTRVLEDLRLSRKDVSMGTSLQNCKPEWYNNELKKVKLNLGYPHVEAFPNVPDCSEA